MLSHGGKSLEINVMLNVLNRLMLPYPAQDGTPGSAHRIAPLLSTSDFRIISRFPPERFLSLEKVFKFFSSTHQSDNYISLNNQIQNAWLSGYKVK